MTAAAPSRKASSLLMGSALKQTLKGYPFTAAFNNHFLGAPDRNWTCDPLITNQLLFLTELQKHWMVRLGSNQRNIRFKAWCLTSWLLTSINKKDAAAPTPFLQLYEILLRSYHLQFPAVMWKVPSIASERSPPTIRYRRVYAKPFNISQYPARRNLPFPHIYNITFYSCIKLHYLATLRF